MCLCSKTLRGGIRRVRSRSCARSRAAARPPRTAVGGRVDAEITWANWRRWPRAPSWRRRRCSERSRRHLQASAAFSEIDQFWHELLPHADFEASNLFVARPVAKQKSLLMALLARGRGNAIDRAGRIFLIEPLVVWRCFGSRRAGSGIADSPAEDFPITELPRRSFSAGVHRRIDPRFGNRMARPRPARSGRGRDWRRRNHWRRPRRGAAPDGYTLSFGHWSTHVINGECIRSRSIC